MGEVPPFEGVSALTNEADLFLNWDYVGGLLGEEAPGLPLSVAPLEPAPPSPPIKQEQEQQQQQQPQPPPPQPQLTLAASSVPVDAASGPSDVSLAPPAGGMPQDDEMDDEDEVDLSKRKKGHRAKLLREEMNELYKSLHQTMQRYCSKSAMTGMMQRRGIKRPAVLGGAQALIDELGCLVATLRNENCVLMVEYQKMVTWKQEHLCGGEGAEVEQQTKRPKLADATREHSPSPAPRAGSEEEKKLPPSSEARAAAAAAAMERVFRELPLVVLGFLDPKSLSDCRQLSRFWRARGGWDCCWRPLALRRWRMRDEAQELEAWRQQRPQLALPDWRALYRGLHREVAPPAVATAKAAAGASAAGSGATDVVLGRTRCDAQPLAAWLVLACRSNGQTGRAVKDCAGHFRSMEILQLTLRVQNVWADEVVLPAQDFHLSREGQVGGFGPVRHDARFCNRTVLESSSSSSSSSSTGSGSVSYREAEVPLGEPVLLRRFDSAKITIFLHVPGCPSEHSFLRACSGDAPPCFLEFIAETSVSPTQGIDGRKHGARQQTSVVLALHPEGGATAVQQQQQHGNASVLKGYRKEGSI